MLRCCGTIFAVVGADEYAVGRYTASAWFDAQGSVSFYFIAWHLFHVCRPYRALTVPLREANKQHSFLVGGNTL